MSEATPADETPQIEVHALLVCREIQAGKTGGVSVREVLDIVPVLQLPGDAGPLTFAAFVRAHRAGEAKVSFRIFPLGDPSVTLVDLPGRLVVQKGYEGRQNVIAAGFKSLTVKAGGWFGVDFRVGETVLATTRFLIGAMVKKGAPPPAPRADL